MDSPEVIWVKMLLVCVFAIGPLDIKQQSAKSPAAGKGLGSQGCVNTVPPPNKFST